MSIKHVSFGVNPISNNYTFTIKRYENHHYNSNKSVFLDITSTNMSALPVEIRSAI